MANSRKKLDIEGTINKLTLEEKVALLAGSKIPMQNNPVKRLNIEALTFNDGPNGIRPLTETGNSLSAIADTLTSTIYPCGAMLASSWDKNIFYKVGEGIAKEALFYGADVILGPSVNIKRNPLCGRNFEYYSEDPFLAGHLAASYVIGMQAHHIGACVKHYACNNSENYRFIGNALVDERALREIYLKPYEIIIKEANPYSFMSSYNMVNNYFVSENKDLLNGFLRKENNYTGVIMTDWGGTHDRVDSLNAGEDMEMPGNCAYNIDVVVDAAKKGKIKEETLNKSVYRLLDLYNKTISEEKVNKSVFEENYKDALKAAEEGAVLLKNDSLLPLKKDKKYLIIGDFFANPRYQGSGSSLLNPYKYVSLKETFNKNKINYTYLRGYYSYENENKDELDKLKKLNIDEYDAILFFGGQSDFVESEGFDRETIKLPSSQLNLISALKEHLNKLVFILFAGSVVELPFKNKVNAILNMFMPGEAVGEATYNLLFGLKSPCGKLSETFVKTYEDVPSSKDYDKYINDYYKESIYIGYRYYDSANVEAAYPFGYGLTYTSFEYSNLNVETNNQKIILTYDIQNKGSYDAKEISEVYVSKIKSNIYRPLKELKGFDKSLIKVNETKSISVQISLDDLKVFDPVTKKRVLEEGEYEILIGASSQDIRLRKTIKINGESIISSENLAKLNDFYANSHLKDLSKEKFASLFNFKYQVINPYKKPYTMETPIFAYETFFGKIFRKSVVGVGEKKIKEAKKITNEIERNRQIKAGVFVSKLMPFNSLRSLSFSSGGGLPYHIARGILEMINNHFLRGLAYIVGIKKPN